MANHTSEHIEIWREETDHLVALLRSLDESDGDIPTDLPGWTVRDIVAHLAHLESVLTGAPQPTADDAEVDAAAHVRSDMGRYCEAGVLARRGRSIQELLGELVASVDQRYGYLLEHPIDDETSLSDGFGAMLGWSWETLLRNRIVDVWVHGQDIRRAVGRPGNLDCRAAWFVADLMSGTLPAVWAGRVKAPAGASLVLETTGDPGRVVGVLVADDGHARLVEPPEDPTVCLRLTGEDWILLATGRRAADDVEAEVVGDAELGRAVLERMNVVP